MSNDWRKSTAAPPTVIPAYSQPNSSTPLTATQLLPPISFNEAECPINIIYSTHVSEEDSRDTINVMHGLLKDIPLS